jgi:hypothetical protein
MRVRFKMDGGFVYLATRSEPTTIDTEDLPAEEANELQRLVEAAGFFELPETIPPHPGAADYLQYTISVTSCEHTHTVQLTDLIEDPALRALVEYLEAKAGT